MTIDPQDFKSAMACWASGVTVLTSQYGEQRLGITASSFSSLSLEPPRILVCVAKRLYTHQAISESGIFAVNILSTEQLPWGMLFAGMLPEQEDRFADIDVQTAVTGSPILPGVLGWLDCRLAQAYDGGDHSIFMGDVVAAGRAGEGEPILYYNRQWRELAPQVLEYRA